MVSEEFTCTKCKGGFYLQIAKSPCVYDCSQITGCDEFGDRKDSYWNCDVENGELYCYSCINGKTSLDF